MTLRYVCSTVAAGVLALGVTAGLANAQQRDGGLLPPNQGGVITVTGCLMRGDQVRSGDKDKFVLANPTTAPIASVPEATCTAERDANAVQLDNLEKGPIDESMLGKWVQINGRLEKEESQHDNLREFDVHSATLIPVAQRAAAAPAPEPEPVAAAVEPSPEPAPVATSGQEPALPKTAGEAPTFALFGLLAIAGSLALRAIPARQRG